MSVMRLGDIECTCNMCILNDSSNVLVQFNVNLFIYGHAWNGHYKKGVLVNVPFANSATRDSLHIFHICPKASEPRGRGGGRGHAPIDPPMAAGDKRQITP